MRDSSWCQDCCESRAVSDGQGEGGMAQGAGWLDAGDGFTEGDAEAAHPVGGHGQPSVGKGETCRSRGLEEAEWSGECSGCHVGENCSYPPRPESDGELVVAYSYRRGGRGDAEGQAGEPVRSGEPERKDVCGH